MTRSPSAPARTSRAAAGSGTNALIIIRDVTIKGAGADLVTITPRSRPRRRRPDHREHEPEHPQRRRRHRDDQRRACSTPRRVSGAADGQHLRRHRRRRRRLRRGRHRLPRRPGLDHPQPRDERRHLRGRPTTSRGPAGTAAPAGHRHRPVTDARDAPLDDARRASQDRPHPRRQVQQDRRPDRRRDQRRAAADRVRHRRLGRHRASQIIGRTLCINYQVTGNCSQPPRPATTGPLFGQDGVRVTAGSYATVDELAISQNLVHGTGAPTGRGDQQRNLTLGAGVRADRRRRDASTTRTTTSSTTPTACSTSSSTGRRAEHRGRRSRPRTTGGACAPTRRPPNPARRSRRRRTRPRRRTRSTAPRWPTATGATTSNAVDFFPYRNGSQSDPNTGEFPVLDGPDPVNDAAPTVTLATDPATATRRHGHAHRRAGGRLRRQARALLRRPWRSARVDPAVHAQLHDPGDVTCARRTFTAVATDSAGQTGSASATIDIDADDCSGTPQPTRRRRPTADGGRHGHRHRHGRRRGHRHADAEPQQQQRARRVRRPVGLVRQRAREHRVRGRARQRHADRPAGIRQVDVFLGTRRMCTLTAAPFACKVRPRGADVGRQTLRVVVTDLNGATAETSRNVVVAAVQAEGLSVARRSHAAGVRTHDHRQAQAARPGHQGRGLPAAR